MRDLAKLRDLRATLGAWTTILYLLDRLGGRTGGVLRARSYRLVAQPVSAAPRCPATRGKAFTTRELVPGDPALARLPIDAATLDFRFGQGARCLGLFRGETAVGCLWLQVGAYDEDEVRCRFVPCPEGTAAWDFDVYVDPSHRLGPAFAKLWDAAEAFMRARDIAWSMSRISPANSGSLRSHARLGAGVVGSAHFLLLGPVQLTLTTLRPRVHLALTRRQRPTIRVRPPSRHGAAPAPSSGATAAAGDRR